MDYRAALGRPKDEPSSKPISKDAAPTYRKKDTSTQSSSTHHDHGHPKDSNSTHQHRHEHRKPIQKSDQGNLSNPWANTASSGSQSSEESSRRSNSSKNSKKGRKKQPEVVEEPKQSAFEKIKALHQERNAALLQKLMSMAKDLDDSDSGDEGDKNDNGAKGEGNVSETEISGQGSQAKNEKASRCTICLNRVKADQAIWQCTKCYCDSFHLNCIIGWIKKNGSVSSDASATSDSSEFPGLGNQQTQPSVFVQQSAAMLKFRSTFWQCPNCRGPHELSKAPKEYYCYCGKVKDPEYDPWRSPHTCGALCGRKLECGHFCSERCHQGKCAPCAVQLDSDCYCGANSAMLRCIDKKWSCGERCGALLNCKRHRCALSCHEGPCPPCSDVSPHACQCGTNIAPRSCIESVWQCEKICKNFFGCEGQHACQRACHAPGTCGPCPLTQPLSCYCGKTTHAAQANCKNVKSLKFACAQTCSKPLSCGAHLCERKCHEGDDCGACAQISNRACLCGKTKQKGPCAQSYRCTKTCDLLRNCGKHKCGVRCCAGSATPQSSAKLASLNTSSDSSLQELSSSSEQVLTCPPCNKICEKRLDCGLCICKKVCHGDEPCEPCTQVRVNRCRCGFVTETVPCSPKRILQHLVRKSCIGGHITKMVDCGTSPYLDCKRRCGNLLSCGNCVCEKTCHEKTRLRSLHSEEMEVEVMKNENCDLVDCEHAARKSSPEYQGGPHVHTERRVVERVEEACTELAPLRKAKNGVVYTPQRHAHAHLTLPIAEDGSEDSIYIPPNSSDDTCDQCEKKCAIRYLTCEHAHRGACHLGDCPPCDFILYMDCHCFAKRLPYECHELLNPKRFDVVVKSCAQPCPYKLPCSHKCTKKCHSGKCTDQCMVATKVTCKCKNLRKDLPCHEATKMRTALRAVDNALLECEAECIAKRSSKNAKKEKERDAKLKEEISKAEEKIALQRQQLESARARKAAKDVFSPLSQSSSSSSATPFIPPRAGWKFKLTQNDKTIIALTLAALFFVFIGVLVYLDKKKPAPRYRY